MRAIERDAAGIGALAEPVRRRLYQFVCSQPAWVSRDQAADAVGVARHQAKFHLDKLETEGLLETDYARLSGRSGPGAGRTSKLYRRIRRDIAISLPDREYELAGRLMADAIAESAITGAPVVEALDRITSEHGRTIGDAAVSAVGRPDTAQAAFDLAIDVLSRHGYEPRLDGERFVLANCPFHALAEAQTELVCHMNHALINGVAGALRPHCPRALLEPDRNRCCVVIQPSASGDST